MGDETQLDTLWASSPPVLVLVSICFFFLFLCLSSSLSLSPSVLSFTSHWLNGLYSFYIYGNDCMKCNTTKALLWLGEWKTLVEGYCYDMKLDDYYHWKCKKMCNTVWVGIIDRIIYRLCPPQLLQQCNRVRLLPLQMIFGRVQTGVVMISEFHDNQGQTNSQQQ